MNDPEFAAIVARLQQEQADENERAQSSPELEAVKSRLRAEMESEGGPCLERLRAIGASSDFKSALAVRNLDFDKLVADGVSPDLVAHIDSTLKQLAITYNGTLRMLETIPHRISHLISDDIERSRYKELPSGAERVSADIRSGAGNVREVSQRVETLKGLVSKLANLPRRNVTMFRPQVPIDRGTHNPAFAQTVAE